VADAPQAGEHLVEGLEGQARQPGAQERELRYGDEEQAELERDAEGAASDAPGRLVGSWL